MIIPSVGSNPTKQHLNDAPLKPGRLRGHTPSRVGYMYTRGLRHQRGDLDANVPQWRLQRVASPSRDWLLFPKKTNKERQKRKTYRQRVIFLPKGVFFT